MSGNGKDEKLKRFQESPDDFVEIKDLILAAQKTEKGIAVLIGHPGIMTRNDLLIAKAELNHLAEQRLNQLDLQKHLQNKPRIHQPKRHGIMDFARKKQ